MQEKTFPVRKPINYLVDARSRGKLLIRRALLCSLTALGFVGCASDHKPTDQQMIALFKSHRAGFDRLLEMQKATPKVTDVSLSREAAEFYGPQGKVVLPTARRSAYESELRAIGADGVSYSNEEVCYYLWVNSSGMGPGMDWEGICYRARDPKVLPSTDDPTILTREDRRRVYRRISGHWYIFYNPTT